MKKVIQFIFFAFVLPIIALYLVFAFAMWDFSWAAHTDTVTRVIFIGILMFCLLGSTSIANDEIY